MVYTLYTIYGGGKIYTRQTLARARSLAVELSYKDWCDGALVYKDGRYIGMSTWFRTVEDSSRNFYNQYNVWIPVNNKIYNVMGSDSENEIYPVSLDEKTYNWVLKRAKEKKKNCIESFDLGKKSTKKTLKGVTLDFHEVKI